MLKKLIPILFISLLLSSCSLKKEGPSALQISANPKSTVFLDDKEVGKTPYYDEKLKPLEYTLKLVPENSQFATYEAKVKLSPEVLTVVNRELGLTTDISAGEILTLEKIDQRDTSEVSIVTTPNLTNVKFDKQDQGQSPTLVKNVTPSDHEIIVSLPGYIERTVKIKTATGYKLNATIQLAAITALTAQQASPSPTITAKPATSPKPSPQASGTEAPVIDANKVLVLDTPTGWLRVRVEPSLAASEAAKVNPGEKYPFLEEQSGWVKIEYQSGKNGWVSSQYVKKIKE